MKASINAILTYLLVIQHVKGYVWKCEKIQYIEMAKMFIIRHRFKTNLIIMAF